MAFRSVAGRSGQYRPKTPQTMQDDSEVKGYKVLDLAERDGVTLRKEGPGEWAGPCPLCGGDDRFHVTKGGYQFFCRTCHPHWGDAAGYIMWRRNVSYPEAVRALTGKDTVTVTDTRPASPPAAPSAGSGKWGGLSSARVAPVAPSAGPVEDEGPTFDADYYGGKLQTAQALLSTPEGQAGRDYLTGRGFTAQTWERFGFGFDPSVAVPGSSGQNRAPAIAIPWYRGGALSAIRYRFLTPQTRADRPDKTVKQTSRGSFMGIVWGGRGLPGFGPVPAGHTPIERLRTLIVCEGELNAASIWQVAHEAAVDVVSLGSESQSITPDMRGFFARYGAVLVWMDKPTIRDARIAEAGAILGIATEQTGGLDANDRLQDGTLQALIVSMQYQASGGDVDRLNGIAWDWFDAGRAGMEIRPYTLDHLRKMAFKLDMDIETGAAWEGAGV